MVSQKVPQVNPETKQKFGNSGNSSQLPEPLRVGCENLRTKCGRTKDLLAAEIIEGSNDKACDILRVLDCKVLVPGTQYVTLADMADYYDIKPSTIYGIMRRWFGKIDESFAPDIIKGHPKSAANTGKPKLNLLCANCDLAKYAQQQQYEGFGRETFYSARLFLAFPALMGVTREAHRESPANKMYNIMLKTTYYDTVVERQKAEIERRREEERLENAAKPAESSEQVSVMITPEVFSTMMKSISHSVAQECASEIMKQLRSNNI